MDTEKVLDPNGSLSSTFALDNNTGTHAPVANRKRKKKSKNKKDASKLPEVFDKKPSTPLQPATSPPDASAEHRHSEALSPRSLPPPAVSYSDQETVGEEQYDSGVGEEHVDTTSVEDANRERIRAWLDSQTGKHYNNLSARLRTRLISFLLPLKFPSLPTPVSNNSIPPNTLAPTHDHPTTLRLQIWRTVLRSNFFWIPPSTRPSPTSANPPHANATAPALTSARPSKPLPLRTPTAPAATETEFDLFLSCAAERLDRIGRDLPPPEHVASIETHVRRMLAAAEVDYNARLAGSETHLAAGSPQGSVLELLAWMLVFDEVRSNVLTFEELGEKVCAAFDFYGRSSSSTAEWGWKGAEVWKATSSTTMTNATTAGRRGKGKGGTGPVAGGTGGGQMSAARSSLVVAEGIWRDVLRWEM